MVRVSFRADALSKKLRHAPGEIQKQLREAMDISVRDVQERAREEHKFISRTDQAEGSIHTTVEGSGDHLAGTVYTALPHAVYQHQGTRSHTIVPRSKTVLRWSEGGQFVFAKRSQVKGIQADPFIFNAFDKEKPAIISRFKKVTEKLGMG